MTKPAKMLTADRVGIGLVILGLVGARMGILSMALLGLGVLGPSLLRELGWLRDDDDFTRQAMHRAGFHALLPLVVLLTANRIMANSHESLPAAWGQHGLYFDLEFLVQLPLAVFVMSFLIQYWGPRSGVARVLMGLAALVTIQIFGAHLYHRNAVAPSVAGATLVIALLLCGLAWLSSRRPRVGGGVLLVLCLASLIGLGFDIAGAGSLPEHVQDHGLVWAMAMAMVWAVVLLGGMGVALVKDPT